MNKNVTDKIVFNENSLKKIISCMPNNVYWLDKNCITQGCNNNVLKLVGLNSIDEFIGIDYKKMGEIAHWTEGQAQSFERDDKEVIATGIAKLNVQEPPVYDENGKPQYYISSRVPIFDENNEVIGVVGISTDITKQKQLEKSLQETKIYLQNVIGSNPHCIFWKDKSSVYLGCNERFANLVGKLVDEVIGKTDFDFGWEKGEPELFRSVDQKVMMGELYLNIEERVSQPDGSEIIMLVSKVPLISEEGECLGILGVSADITAQKKLQQEVEAFASNAAQVAHDIRSPLAALSVVAGVLKDIPENYRIILRDSVARINDIAHNLLTQYKNPSMIENESNLYAWLVAPLLESLISEKRLQHEHLTIETQISSEAFLAFSYFNAVEMKRMISNLVNNAAEAFDYENGKIIISLSIQDNQVILKIQDNGCGISAEKLALVFQEGVSFKKHGSGLGLSHAKKSIEAWKGKINLESKLNAGTRVSITLPMTETPAWFGAAIEVSSDNTIVILDDDDSIHGAWNERFAASDAKHVPIVHFKLPRDLWHWCNDNQDKNVIVLSDYEILGQQLTGLDVLEKIKLGEKSFLVTSHYENQRILKRCEAANIKLLPKNLISHVAVVLK